MTTSDYFENVAALQQDAKARGKLRGKLRAARGAALADAEGFEVVVHAIETVGKWISPHGDGLAKYTPGLLHLVQAALGWAEEERRVVSLEAAFFLLRQTRNDYAHRGVHARNATGEAIRVALVLEDALSFNWAEVRLRDLMVRRPVTAESDDSLAEIRRTMLSCSFSFVPVRIDDRWRLVSERWIAEQIVGKTRKHRDAALARRVHEFEAQLVPVEKVFTDSVTTAELPKPLPDLMLVAEEEVAMVLQGVVSPSDLL